MREREVRGGGEEEEGVERIINRFDDDDDGYASILATRECDSASAG